MKAFSKFIYWFAIVCIAINASILIILFFPFRGLFNWLEDYVIYSFVITPCVCLGLIFISLCQAYLNKEIRKQSLKNSLFLLISGIIPILTVLYIFFEAAQSGFRG